MSAGRRGSSRNHASLEETTAAGRLTLRLADAGLAAVIFLAPLVFAGRHPAGALAYVLVVGLTAACWALHQSCTPQAGWRRCGALLLFVGAALIVFLQTVSLPREQLSALSPHQRELLPSWQEGSPFHSWFGDWSKLSLIPAETQQGLAVLIAHGLLFAVVVQRTRSRQDVERWLRWIALATVGMAALGLTQYLGGNGKYLWCYLHPYRDPGTAATGPFFNPNHFANFLALGAAPLMWWLSKHVSTDRRHDRWLSRGSFGASGQGMVVLLSFGLLITAVAAILSYSRGGIAVFVLACVIGSAPLFRGQWKTRHLLITAAAGLVIVLAVLQFHGSDRLISEFETVTDSSSLTSMSEGRQHLWRALQQAIPDFFWTGAGVGCHRFLYPTYLSEVFATNFSHAESGYLQVLVEAGMAGFLLVMLSIAVGLRWLFGAWRRGSAQVRPAVIAVAAGLIASVVHAIVDFSWYIPACMSLTVLLAACAQRLAQLQRDDSDARARCLPQPVWGALAVLLLLVTGWQASVLLPPALAAPHWDRFVALLEASDRFNPIPLRGAAAELGPVDGAHPETLRGMLRHLQLVVECDPSDAHAHLRLSGVAIQLFEAQQLESDNAMPLNQVRDAALASDFPDQDALKQWLQRAIGDNLQNLELALRHTLIGLRLCPLQGEGYAYLVEVGFMAGLKADGQDALIAQALKVRPHDASVLYLAGREAWLRGEIQDAVDYMRAAFQRSVAYRNKVIRHFAGILPVDDFVKLFQPRMPELASLYVFYEKQQMPQQQRLAGALYADSLMQAARNEQGDAAAELWLQASQVCRQIAQPHAALQCAEASHHYAPNRLEVRRQLGECLLDVQRFADAEKHLRWCLNRRPNDADLRRIVEYATKERMRQSSPERHASAPRMTTDE